MLSMLEGLANKRMMQFQSTIQEDDQFLSHALTRNARNAIVLRRSEKQILMNLVEFCQRTADLLEVFTVKPSNKKEKAVQKRWARDLRTYLISSVVKLLDDEMS